MISPSKPKVKVPLQIFSSFKVAMNENDLEKIDDIINNVVKSGDFYYKKTMRRMPSALAYANSVGRYEIVEKLLNKGADPNRVENWEDILDGGVDGSLPAMWSCLDFKICSTDSEKFEVYQKERFVGSGLNCLTLMLPYCSEGTLKSTCRNGSNLFHYLAHGMEGAEEKYLTEITKAIHYLYDHGVDIHHRNNFGETPLLATAADGPMRKIFRTIEDKERMEQTLLKSASVPSMARL